MVHILDMVMSYFDKYCRASVYSETWLAHHC